MLYILYWFAILIISFILLTLIKIYKLEDEELPLPKEAIYQSLTILAIIASLIFAITIPGLNFKNKSERNTKIKLNEIPCWWKN